MPRSGLVAGVGGGAPVALRKAASPPGIDGTSSMPESSWYSVKRRLLGPPLASEQLRVERLSKPLGLGVLSCDGISSANYGSELILHELLPFFGLAAFSLLLPMTGVILLGVAQVAAVALMVDYVVTVAVQTAAGSAAILSTFPALARPLGDTTTLLLIA